MAILRSCLTRFPSRPLLIRTSTSLYFQLIPFDLTLQYLEHGPVGPRRTSQLVQLVADFVIHRAIVTVLEGVLFKQAYVALRTSSHADASLALDIREDNRQLHHGYARDLKEKRERCQQL